MHSGHTGNTQYAVGEASGIQACWCAGRLGHLKFREITARDLQAIYSAAHIWTQSKHHPCRLAQVIVPSVGGVPFKCLWYNEDEQEPEQEQFWVAE